MKLLKINLTLIILFLLSYPACAQEGDPKKTEVWEPEPPIVSPGMNNSPPSDAIILFGGKSLEEWESVKNSGKPAEWTIEKGFFTVKKGTGSIQTKQKFMDYQLHLEFRSPKVVEGEGQGRGNSGLFLAGTGAGDLGYEIQILDNYNNKTYVNGQVGSIYKQHIPLANASRKPGEWQTYDIVWTAPRFNEDGSLKSPARITAFHNGVLVQNNVEVKGVTVYIGEPFYKAHGACPIKLQDHGNPVSFRNIWLRKL
jgi:hypothetical protein